MDCSSFERISAGLPGAESGIQRMPRIRRSSVEVIIASIAVSDKRTAGSLSNDPHLAARKC